MSEAPILDHTLEEEEFEFAFETASWRYSAHSDQLEESCRFRAIST